MRCLTSHKNEICGGQDGPGLADQDDHPIVMGDLQIASGIPNRQITEPTRVTDQPQHVFPIYKVLNTVGSALLLEYKDIRAAVARQAVVTTAPIQYVAAFAADQRISTILALQSVRTVIASQRVALIAADQSVRPPPDPTEHSHPCLL